MDHETEGVLANIDQARLSREGIKLVGAIELLQHYATQVENLLNNRKHLSRQAREVLVEIRTSLRIDTDAAVKALIASMKDGASRQ
jgi:hypothetical protein